MADHKAHLDPQQEAIYKKHLKENDGLIEYTTEEGLMVKTDTYFSSYENVFKEAFFNEFD